ncbi:Vault protein inter-alpha-trypsin domain protein OS=Pedosphaera parvula (strain Ellin514) GN=Cflav_PD1158 PE=4 SV=1: VIT: VWA_3 [Gemmata massiliana]|uniref:VWFA domain-containing protein n=1 Tax=Gemmata massiliana TaxID=1210884 RepID=A0A6P2D117_9BACT|nr:VIT and VWA domain-containing protein [Gemmata massiliana]VTR94951.1 Vault protein inter-alpha-trypsin domain protein OS=Pedosphaera parvula (strain Ellin514) GN=Cflav_PD1158 PE=4 SV=1: VIT: VWA_3 [Gemmata massiliana]
MRFLRSTLAVLAAILAGASSASASGILIPEDKKLPPLAMVNHKVTVAIDEQVAITTVEQSFRNHTDRNLEATYLFPVPKGATVDKFTMWVDGKEMGGELLDAKHAHKVYTDIVRRTQDPGLLEYLGNSLLRLSVFPVPPKGDQKIKISYKFVAQKDGNVVEYIYPLKTDGKANRTLEAFSVNLTIKSRHAVQNVYSPTHAITTTRKSDREVNVAFERNQAILDKDFQLFYGFGDKDIGLTPLLYKPITGEDGYFMFLVSPQVEAEKKRVPRDLVLVLDTSSSMSDIKMQQAKKALKFCLTQLKPEDRFAILKFSTSVVPFRDKLVEANKDYLEAANKWVDGLKTSGGTAIWPALDEALGMRSDDPSRPFTMVFFTDGQPTVDETNPDKIVKNVMGKNSGNTRIFTFGVGDDVNAAMLDQLADATRAITTYVREAEDIEAKVASLYGKISHPVLTDVKLATTGGIQLHEIYPPKLPDLFQGTQLVVIGRYTGNGHSAIRLTGTVGKEKQEFVYELNFPPKTESDTGKDFVEPLWARRKVGYILDQIRVNGEKKELIDEVVALAKRYGIATPYTSHLVVPDGPMPVVPPTVRPGGPLPRPGTLPAAPIAGGGFGGASGIPAGPGGGPQRVEDFAKNQAAGDKGDGKSGLAGNRGSMTERQVKEAIDALKSEKDPEVRAKFSEEVKKLAAQKRTWDEADRALKGGKSGYQTGQLGVDLSCAANGLRNQDRVSLTANRQVYGRNCLEIGGVWIDDGYKADTKSVTVKAQSDAYFRILEKHPQIKDVYRLGNHVVWMTPSGTTLVVDPNDGKDKMEDADIEALFVKK